MTQPTENISKFSVFVRFFNKISVMVFEFIFSGDIIVIFHHASRYCVFRFLFSVFSVFNIIEHTRFTIKPMQTEIRF